MYYRSLIDFVKSESTKKNKDGTPVLFQIGKILNNLKNNGIDYASARNTAVRYGETNIVLRAVNSCQKEDSTFEKISITTGEINLIFFTSELHKSGLNVYEMSKDSEEFEEYLISLIKFTHEVVSQVAKVEGLDKEYPRTIEAKLATQAPMKLFFLANDVIAKCFAEIFQDPDSSIKKRFPKLYDTGYFSEDLEDEYYKWLMAGTAVEILYGLCEE